MKAMDARAWATATAWGMAIGCTPMIDEDTRARAGSGAGPEAAASDAPIVFTEALGQGALDTNPCAPSRWCNEAQILGLTTGVPMYGRGAAWVDVDADGWDDLWVSHDRFPGQGSVSQSSLWRNMAGEGFRPWSIGIHPDDTWSNWSGAWADYDNDGDPDLYLVNGGYSAYATSRLYRNDLTTTGAFTEVTEAAGMLAPPSMDWGASWADVDRDGRIDLVVTSRTDRWPAPCCRAMGGEPEAASEAPVRLYHNLGDGTFEERGGKMGLGRTVLDTKNPVWLDYDRDGWPDLFIANAGATTWQNTRDDEGRAAMAGTAQLFRNLGGESFEDVTQAVLTDSSWTKPVFSAAVADFNQDGWDDLYLGRSFDEDRILINQGGAGFAARGAEHGLDKRPGWTARENTMGLGVADFDEDGVPDVWVGTGWPDFSAPAVPFRTLADGHVERIPMSEMGGYESGWNHGMACSDFDHDGDMDLLSAEGGFPLYDRDHAMDSRQQPVLLVGHPARPASTVAVRLRGVRSNRDAIGARLVVRSDNVVRYDVVTNMNGFQSLDSAWQTFPVGPSGIAVLTITWPTGRVQTETLRVGERRWVTER